MQIHAQDYKGSWSITGKIHEQRLDADAQQIASLPTNRQGASSFTKCFRAGKCTCGDDEGSKHFAVLPTAFSSNLAKLLVKGSAVRKIYDQNQLFIRIFGEDAAAETFWHVGMGNLNNHQVTLQHCIPCADFVHRDDIMVLERVGVPANMQVMDKLSVDVSWSMEVLSLVVDCEEVFDNWRPVAMVRPMREPVHVIFWDPQAAKRARLANLPIGMPAAMNGYAAVENVEDPTGEEGMLNCGGERADDQLLGWFCLNQMRNQHQNMLMETLILNRLLVRTPRVDLRGQLQEFVLVIDGHIVLWKFKAASFKSIGPMEFSKAIYSNVDYVVRKS